MTCIKQILEQKRKIIDSELENIIHSENTKPDVLHKAIRYSIFSSAKRIRPILCLLVYELFNTLNKDIIKLACSLELMHTYTLIHDDLPCMDNDDLRRGKPTLHKVYSESIALLAGDSLLTEVFFVIAKYLNNMPEVALNIIRELSEYCGSKGVIGGQVLDLMNENNSISKKELEEIHYNKTAKLIIASVRIGAMLGKASKNELCALTFYAENIGFAFQIADDILDEIGDSKKMGKNTGQDKKLSKATYPKIIGMEKSKEILNNYINLATESLDIFGEKAKYLKEVARYIGSRES